MRLSDLLPELSEKGIRKIGMWEFRNRRGVYLGDPTKYFPNPSGPQYPVDTTDDKNPELTEAEVAAIRRRFDGYKTPLGYSTQ